MNLKTWIQRIAGSRVDIEPTAAGSCMCSKAHWQSATQTGLLSLLEVKVQWQCNLCIEWHSIVPSLKLNHPLNMILWVHVCVCVCVFVYVCVCMCLYEFCCVCLCVCVRFCERVWQHESSRNSLSPLSTGIRWCISRHCLKSNTLKVAAEGSIHESGRHLWHHSHQCTLSRQLWDNMCHLNSLSLVFNLKSLSRIPHDDDDCFYYFQQ